MSNILYTYRTLEELQKIIKQEEAEKRFVINFSLSNLITIFDDTTINITNFIIDINNKFNSVSYLEKEIKNILKNNSNVKIIVKDDYSNNVMEYFFNIFNRKENIFNNEIDIQTTTLYTYDDISNIRSNDNITIISIGEILHYNINNFNNKYIDITNIIIDIKNILNFEIMILNIVEKMQSSRIIIHDNYANDAIKYFPHIFDGVVKLSHEDLNIKEENKIAKYIVDIDNISSEIINKLIGHDNFKSDLIEKLKNFKILNLLKVKKIFSIFIFGPSGIGKTEVARLLAEAINEKPNFPKINFGNYSSKDALNSLIGSPRGFVGSDNGELSIKLNNSNVGIILCDEFEKADRAIFNFFLELLEDGKFTDSQSREYNLDKYIVIFTSNIENQNQYNQIIPNSLTTRFDMIYYFEPPTKEDKKQFIELFCNSLINHKNLKSLGVEKISDKDIEELKACNYDNINSLRDIKLILENKFIKIIENYIKKSK